MKNLNFETAFKYPFNRAKGLTNIFWIFVPIIGWFALGGYCIRITQEFIKGKFDKLPEFEFSNDLNLGFYMFLKSLPFAILYGALSSILDQKDSGAAWLLNLFISLFIVPILTINFYQKQTIASYFEFSTLKPVFEHLGDYTIALLKSILLGIIFLIMWIVLVGIPAGAFTKNIFLADFYGRRVK